MSVLREIDISVEVPAPLEAVWLELIRTLERDDFSHDSWVRLDGSVGVTFSATEPGRSRQGGQASVVLDRLDDGSTRLDWTVRTSSNRLHAYILKRSVGRRVHELGRRAIDLRLPAEMVVRRTA